MISPILANIYLHYVFDLWANAWRDNVATGEMIVIRYADDVVAGFQQQSDAQRFLTMLGVRMRKFELTLHPDKTRLIRFGRFARVECRKRGERKPHL